MNTLEQTYVHNTYQVIAEQFSHTRAYLWKSVKEFIDSLPANSILVEAGSGNGKNMKYRKDIVNISFDLCSKFCEMTQKDNIDSLIANNLTIPIKSNSVDNVLSIAVIHHLSTYERRLQCLKELVRILKPNGKLLIQVWAFEQSVKSKIQFTKQENLIEFKNPQQTMKEYRYYYVFKKNELDNMVNSIQDIKIVKSFWEVGNWVMIIEKL